MDEAERTQMRIDSQTAYNDIQIEAQDRLDAIEARNQAEFDSWTPEEQAEATATAERLNQASIRDFGVGEQERWDALQERTRQSFLDKDGRNVVVNRLVQNIMDEARVPEMPSPYDED